MKANLEYLARHPQLPTVDALAVAILSHGTDDHVFGTDAVYINVCREYLFFSVSVIYTCIKVSYNIMKYCNNTTSYAL